VVSSEPAEEVREGPRVLRRVHARLEFEKKQRGPVEAVFTFERVGTWKLADFHLPLKDPRREMNAARVEELLRRSALEGLEQLGRLRLDVVWRTLARHVRIAASVEVWQPEMERRLDGIGPFVRVEPGAWTPGEGRGVLDARIVGAEGAVNARVEAAFDADEGRVVFERVDVTR
jgi:hypothetical protein